jgi:HSP20 family molecular chaperone IbpA
MATKKPWVNTKKKTDKCQGISTIFIARYNLSFRLFFFMDKGILTINLPKSEETKTKEIKIKVH